MDDALFELVDRSGGESSFRATELTRGPWSTDAQHGGPVGALLARQLTRCRDDGAAFHPARLSLALLRPVPLDRVTVSTSTRRDGRKVRILAAELAADDGTVLVRAELQQVRLAAVELPEGTPGRMGPVEPPPGPDTGVAQGPTWEYPHIAFHSHATEHRLVSGSWGEAGPSIDWIRLTVPVVAGEVPSPFERVAAAADFGNGVSAALPYGEYLFINPDLTIHLHRLPAGEWVGLDAASWVSADGVGQAQSTLYDLDGRIGSGLQSLLVEQL